MESSIQTVTEAIMKLSWRASGWPHALLIMSFADESADILC